MASYRDDWRLRGFFQGIGGIVLVGGLAIASGNPALAQSKIVPDATLGAESSVVVPNFNGLPVEAIGGGAQRGQNIFHSFKEFNVSEGRGAYFFSPNAAIQNILARVTGSNRSEILGVLGTFGNSQPNLFLINPNGIIFGRNAQLDVGGSFVASTANSLVFGNGFEFSATNPQAPPLLTVNVPLGLQYGANPGSIVNQSITNGDGLEVQPGRTLALVGGEIAIDGGVLFAPDGRIELGSVAGNSRVSLTPTNTGYTLGYEGVENFQDIRLTQGAFVASDGDGGGSIQVQGRNVTLTDGSQISASLLGAGKGGGLSVIASESVQVIGLSADGRFASGLFAQAVPTATGEAGDLAITTSRLLIQDGALVSASTFGAGKGGNLTVNASDIMQVIGTSSDGKVSSNLSAQANPNSTGDAGNLTIITPRLLISGGAQVSTSTFGEGDAGNLTVKNASEVQVIGRSADGKFGSNLSSQANLNSTGDAGELSITTSRLLIEDGAQVSVRTFGQGNAGNLTVNATEEVQVIGESADGKIGSFLAAQTEGTGNAGDLSITTSRLLIENGAVVSTATFGDGRGGNLTVNASESVQLIGTSLDGQFPSGLFVSAAAVDGIAGNLMVTTGKMYVQDGAEVSVSSPFGQAGNMTVTTNSLTLNRGTISAVTGKSTTQGGANIILQGLDLLRMDNESFIAASALEDANGGNVKIASTFIIATPPTGQEGSDISANAVRGNGGRVSITTQGLFGTQFRPKQTPDNDITASSQFGINGEVTINQPDVDPRRGLTELPTTVVDATRQIDRRCNPTRADQRSSFVITGRGGFPPSPNDPLQDEAVITNWVTLDSEAKHTNSEVPPANSNSTAPQQLVEAQSWVYDADGRVILVAEAPTAKPQSPWQPFPSCRDLQPSANSSNATSER